MIRVAIASKVGGPPTTIRLLSSGSRVRARIGANAHATLPLLEAIMMSRHPNPILWAMLMRCIATGALPSTASSSFGHVASLAPAGGDTVPPA